MNTVIYQQTEQTASTRIIHRMVQYQQQDSEGKLFDIVKLTLANGQTKFVREEVEIQKEEEVVFDLRLAHGHKWYLTSNTMRVEECNHTDCAIWNQYKTKAMAPTRKHLS
jgi:hypothetical protein